MMLKTCTIIYPNPHPQDLQEAIASMENEGWLVRSCYTYTTCRSSLAIAVENVIVVYERDMA